MRVLITDTLLSALEEGREYEIYWIEGEGTPYIVSHLDGGEYTLNDLAYYHTYFELIKEKGP